jgi:hypothetical protein
MGVVEEEGGKTIWFENRKEKQCWVGLLSTMEREFPKAKILSIKDYNR